MGKAAEYMQTVLAMAQKTAEGQLEHVRAAAELTAGALAGGGTVFTFGSGHSHLLAEEIFYRAGGLAKVYPIQEDSLMLHTAASRSSQMERLPGLATLLLDDIPFIRSGDVLFVFANSGRNTVSVEMALAGRARGMKVVGVTSLNHSRSVSSRHPSGKKLYEVCDVVIDNGGVPGDACVPIGGLTCGPSSTVVGAMLIQAVVCEAVELLLSRGIQPEVFLSGNIDGGDDQNQKYIDAYRGQIRML